MDNLEFLFQSQEKLNDFVFEKKQIMARGVPLSMHWIFMEARAGGNLGPNGITNEWLSKYLTALQAESQELRDCLLWKWWSKDTLDMQNIRVEIVDMLHFWISLALVAGMDAVEVVRLYKLKNEVNLARQENGYSQATKTEEDNKNIK